ncbi:MAG: DNA replication/repair protein RecF [Bdellovibrionales bacterium]
MESPLNPECRILNPDSLSIQQLTLFNFRNYGDLRLNLTPAPIVLTGPNGAGKTNILEAVSLLVPGRGLCSAPPAEWQNKRASAPWAVAAYLDTLHGETMIGTGRDPMDPTNDRRIVHIDGREIRSQQKLAEHVVMAWITPDIDRVLVEGPSARRSLIDRMAFSFDPSHRGRVSRYEKAMRERLRLLKDGIHDKSWLSALEDEMASSGVAIAAARLELINRLCSAVAETRSEFPRAALAISGFAEDKLKESPALLVEDVLREALATARAEDAARGISTIGPHRSDLEVTHATRHCPAHLCSTGEQKALLVAIMLAYVRLIAQVRERKPLFLLDDITAHLDTRRRHALFEEIAALEIQAWMTGTDKSFFEGLPTNTQYFSVDDAVVRG